MNNITPVFFTGVFFKMLAMEHFLSTFIVIIFLMICCGSYIYKHREETGHHGVTVAVSIILLMLMCLLFSFVVLRDEQNDYGETYEPVPGPVSYELVKNNNIIYVYEKF